MALGLCRCALAAPCAARSHRTARDRRPRSPETPACRALPAQFPHNRDANRTVNPTELPNLTYTACAAGIHDCIAYSRTVQFRFAFRDGSARRVRYAIVRSTRTVGVSQLSHSRGSRAAAGGPCATDNPPSPVSRTLRSSGSPFCSSRACTEVHQVVVRTLVETHVDLSRTLALIVPHTLPTPARCERSATSGIRHRGGKPPLARHPLLADARPPYPRLARPPAVINLPSRPCVGPGGERHRAPVAVDHKRKALEGIFTEGHPRSWQRL